MDRDRPAGPMDPLFFRSTVAGALALLLAGCVAPTPVVDPSEVFVLEYDLIDLGSGEERYANPGHHCGDATKSGDTLTIWLWPEEEPPETPWLAVFPAMGDGWRVSYGAGPFKTSFPATVDPQVEDDPTVLGVLTWEPKEDGGVLRRDGSAVALPHSWRVTGDDGSWRADLTLYAWDGTVRTDRYDGLCD